MIRIHVSAEDLAQTRFAFGPLWETVESYRAILDPGRHALHLPWISWAREELGGWDLGPLAALVRAEGYMPDFLTPPPTSPFPEFLAEVELLRRTPPERVREEVGRLKVVDSPALRAYLEDPASSVERLAELLIRYHRRVLAPHWPRLHTLLEADVFAGAPARSPSMVPRRSSAGCTAPSDTAAGSSSSTRTSRPRLIPAGEGCS